ncbi:hypothetical protein ACU4GH_31350 [Bradyrhizobium betae]
MRFSVSFRPILAEAETAAWARANAILETRRLREADRPGQGGPQQSEGARRLLAAADKGRRLDNAPVDGDRQGAGLSARSSSTALVGAPEQAGRRARSGGRSDVLARPPSPDPGGLLIRWEDAVRTMARRRLIPRRARQLAGDSFDRSLPPCSLARRASVMDVSGICARRHPGDDSLVPLRREAAAAALAASAAADFYRSCRGRPLL